MAEWSPRVKRVGSNEPGRVAFANALIRERKFREAQEEFEAILRAEPKSYAANAGLGFALQLQGQFDKSLEAFDRARALDPMQPTAPMLAGFSYLVKNNAEEAISSFKSSIDLDPRIIIAHLGLSRALS